MQPKPIPVELLSLAAHTYGHDMVVVLTLSHQTRECRHYQYGRTDEDKTHAERLGKALAKLLAPEPAEGS